MLYLTIFFGICAFMMFMEVKMMTPGTIESNKDQNRLNLILVIYMIYIAGFRNIGGSDFNIYYLIYNRVPELGEFFQKWDVLYDKYYVFGADRGYLLLNSLFKTMGVTCYGFNFFHSMLTILLIYFGTRKYTNHFSMIILIVLYKMFFYDFFVSLRQTVTIAVFLGMVSDIEKKHWLRYFVLALGCYFVHAAAIVLFPVYFISYMKLSQKRIMLLNLIFIPTIAVSLLNIPILNSFDSILGLDIFSSEQIASKAEGLLAGEADEGINWLHTAEYFAIMFFTIWFYDDITQVFPHSGLMIKLFICLLPLFTTFRNYEILTRCKDYFTISYGFILSYLAGIRDGKYRNLIMVFVLVWCGFGFFRFISLFDEGILEYYIPVYKYGVDFFSF